MLPNWAHLSTSGVFITSFQFPKMWLRAQNSPQTFPKISLREKLPFFIGFLPWALNQSPASSGCPNWFWVITIKKVEHCNFCWTISIVWSSCSWSWIIWLSIRKVGGRKISYIFHRQFKISLISVRFISSTTSHRLCGGFIQFVRFKVFFYFLVTFFSFITLTKLLHQQQQPNNKLVSNLIF